VKKTTKVLLAIGAFVVIVPAGIIIAAVLWFQGNRDRLATDGRKARDEGLSYGRQHTKEECEVEALAKNGRCGFGNLVCEVETKLFFHECLRSRPADETT
jgi:hypothetical protein